MSSNSSEILLEVWDQGQKIGKSDIFLGLGIGKKKKKIATYPFFAGFFSYIFKNNS